MELLAIKGHAGRGKEVIDLLKLLGGKSKAIPYDGRWESGYYLLCEDDYIGYSCDPSYGYSRFTLEEFETKFPFKTGDMVDSVVCGASQIVGMAWSQNKGKVAYSLRKRGTFGYKEQSYASELKPLDRELSKDPPILQGEEIDGQRYSYKVPEDMEAEVTEGGEIILKPKQLEWPKTWEECMDLLDEEKKRANIRLTGTLSRLLFARDAYWKIIGEQLCHGKPWTPSDCQIVYGLSRINGKIEKIDDVFGCVMVLEFPSREMRDAFYENFKDLIEECRELL